MAANNSELGDDVTEQFNVRRPTGVVVSARLEHDLAEHLAALSEREGKKVSQLVREAIADFVQRGGCAVIGTTLGSGFAPAGSAVFSIKNTSVTNASVFEVREDRRIPA